MNTDNRAIVSSIVVWLTMIAIFAIF